MKILLAEDAAANVLLFESLLKRVGHDVTVAGDGETAAAEGASGRFDVILMDIGLPRLSGTEAAARIRAAGVATPIIALTAEDEQEARRIAKDHQLHGYLTKPVSPKDLYAAIENAGG